jgi:hypothetical protein
LDGEWTPFVSHNGGSQTLFLFLATQKPSKYKKIKASYEQQIFVHETLLKLQTTIKCQLPFNS